MCPPGGKRTLSPASRAGPHRVPKRGRNHTGTARRAESSTARRQARVRAPVRVRGLPGARAHGYVRAEKTSGALATHVRRTVVHARGPHPLGSANRPPGPNAGAERGERPRRGRPRQTASQRSSMPARPSAVRRGRPGHGPPHHRRGAAASEGRHRGREAPSREAPKVARLPSGRRCGRLLRARCGGTPGVAAGFVRGARGQHPCCARAFRRTAARLLLRSPPEGGRMPVSWRGETRGRLSPSHTAGYSHGTAAPLSPRRKRSWW